LNQITVVLASSTNVDDRARRSRLMVDVERLAIEMGGILHWGQANQQMTSDDVRRVHARLGSFLSARQTIAGHDGPTSFDTLFTRRCGLSS
jgi:hypothetical protein